MSDKELIKQEIERLKHNTPNAYDLSRFMLLEEIESFIDSLPEEPASEDLEEAARHYLLNTHTSPLNNILHQADLKVEMQYHKDIEDAYKAGAEEYKQHMKEAFQTEYEKGRFDMREEMMKDAVGGVVHHFADDEVAAVHYNDPKGTPMSIYVSSKGLSAGDKVKIIIVKEKEEK